MSQNLAAALAKIVGRRHVLTNPEDLATYAYDASAPALDQPPAAVVLPGSDEEVQRVVEFAHARGIPVVARGAGTGLSGAAVPVENCVLILSTRLSHILEVDLPNLTVSVEPGVVTARLASEVERRGLFFPPDPGSMTVSTIGGNVATNAGGLRGLKYGVTGDYVMGLDVVLANGALLTTGGKCRKDVAGYNLKSLFVGSEGTLGIFTKIVLRLLPPPEGKRTMVALFADLSGAAEVVANIIAAHIIPVTLELLDRTCLESVEDYAKLGFPSQSEAMLLIEVDGPKAGLGDQVQLISGICRHHQAIRIDIAEDLMQAETLKTARRATLAALARKRPTTILEDVTVPRDRVPDMIEFIRATASRYKVDIAIFGHAGDGNLHPTGMTDCRDVDELKRVELAFADIFKGALSFGGTISGEHGIGLKKRPFLPLRAGPVGMTTMKALKQALDPTNILNPGKVL